MGMKPLAYDPFISTSGQNSWACRLVDIDLLLQEADYITLHLPKTPETTHLINAESLSYETTDYQLCQAASLTSQHWQQRYRTGNCGCGIDVYETEPLGESP